MDKRKQQDADLAVVAVPAKRAKGEIVQHASSRGSQAIVAKVSLLCVQCVPDCERVRHAHRISWRRLWSFSAMVLVAVHCDSTIVHRNRAKFTHAISAPTATSLPLQDMTESCVSVFWLLCFLHDGVLVLWNTYGQCENIAALPG